MWFSHQLSFKVLSILSSFLVIVERILLKLLIIIKCSTSCQLIVLHLSFIMIFLCLSFIFNAHVVLPWLELTSISMQSLTTTIRWTLHDHSSLNLYLLWNNILIVLLHSSRNYSTLSYTNLLLLLAPCLRIWTSHITSRIIITHFRYRISWYLWKCSRSITSCH